MCLAYLGQVGRLDGPLHEHIHHFQAQRLAGGLLLRMGGRSHDGPEDAGRLLWFGETAGPQKGGRLVKRDWIQDFPARRQGR